MDQPPRLPNRFFRDHPLKELSVATIAHMFIIMLQSGELNQKITEIAAQYFNDERKESIRLDAARIEQTDDPVQLVELTRKAIDNCNRELLCKKLLTMQEQTIPLLLRRFRTSAYDHFLDTATYVFSLCDRRYAYELRELYPEIRFPFAQACACLVFGEQDMQEEIPFLRAQYERFSHEFPDESLNQHPLLALYLLHGKY